MIKAKQKYKCTCGEPIMWEKFKTFAKPDIIQGICVVCNKKFRLVDGVLEEIPKNELSK